MTMQLIESKTLGSAQASIEFTNIPQTYTDLLLVTSLRCSADQAWAKLQINGSDANFSSRSLEGYGTDGVGSYSRSDNLNFIAINKSTWTSNTFSNQSTYIPNYTSSTAKSISIDMVSENNAGSGFTHIMAKLWSGTAAITSLTIVPQTGNLEQYSMASLYGILKGSDGTTTVA